MTGNTGETGLKGEIGTQGDRGVKGKFSELNINYYKLNVELLIGESGIKGDNGPIG